MRSFPEIVAIVRARQAENTVLIDKMIEVKRRYNGEWVLPYLSDEDQAALPPLTPAIIADSIDFVALRAASVMPGVRFPALDPSKAMHRRSREYAQIRRRAIGSVWSESALNLVLRRSYRHLAGYATSALVVVAEPSAGRDGMPVIQSRDPLTSYPEPKAPEDLTPPNDCAFVYSKAADSIRATYPFAKAENGGPIPARGTLGSTVGELWDLVEWIDHEHIVIGILGPSSWQRSTRGSIDATNGVRNYRELSREPNKAGRCTAIVPRRVTLDTISSQVANVTGIVDLMARLQGLNILASEKSIFKDRYIIGHGNSPAELISNGGQWVDGRTGRVNIIQNAQTVGELTSTPDPNNNIQIDRLERNARVTTGLIPQAGGESYGALRTGRGMDSMMATAVDPRVQELQEIMEVSLRQANECVMELFKGQWADRKMTLFSGWVGDSGMFTFQPSEHIEQVENSVNYAIPGTDIQSTTIGLGQLFGTKAISMETFRERHPWIANPEAEAAMVQDEMIETAVLEGLAAQAQQGSIPMAYFAEIIRQRQALGALLPAIEAADKVLKAQQAQQAPPPGPDQHAAPEQMPGLQPESAAPVPPGPPVDPNAGQPQIGPEQAQQGLRHLMRALSESKVPQGKTAVPA